MTPPLSPLLSPPVIPKRAYWLSYFGRMLAICRSTSRSSCALAKVSFISSYTRGYHFWDNTSLEIHIVKPDRSTLMASTADVHHPNLRPSAYQFLQEQVSEEKVADVVYSKLQFHSLWSSRVRCRHDACIVDKMIDALRIVVHLCSCIADTFLRAQVYNE